LGFVLFCFFVWFGFLFKKRHFFLLLLARLVVLIFIRHFWRVNPRAACVFATVPDSAKPSISREIARVLRAARAEFAAKSAKMAEKASISEKPVVAVTENGTRAVAPAPAAVAAAVAPVAATAVAPVAAPVAVATVSPVRSPSATAAVSTTAAAGHTSGDEEPLDAFLARINRKIATITGDGAPEVADEALYIGDGFGNIASSGSGSRSGGTHVPPQQQQQQQDPQQQDQQQARDYQDQQDQQQRGVQQRPPLSPPGFGGGQRETRLCILCVLNLVSKANPRRLF
jgi:hypothetical protein